MHTSQRLNTANEAAPTVAPAKGKVASRWGKRLGMAAFAFFLIKGLAWLIVPAAIAYFTVATNR